MCQIFLSKIINTKSYSYIQWLECTSWYFL